MTSRDDDYPPIVAYSSDGPPILNPAWVEEMIRWMSEPDDEAEAALGVVGRCLYTIAETLEDLMEVRSTEVIGVLEDGAQLYREPAERPEFAALPEATRDEVGALAQEVEDWVTYFNKLAERRTVRLERLQARSRHSRRGPQIDDPGLSISSGRR